MLEGKERHDVNRLCESTPLLIQGIQPHASLWMTAHISQQDLDFCLSLTCPTHLQHQTPSLWGAKGKDGTKSNLLQPRKGSAGYTELKPVFEVAHRAARMDLRAGWEGKALSAALSAQLKQQKRPRDSRCKKGPLWSASQTACTASPGKSPSWQT